jgi:PhnB protein
MQKTVKPVPQGYHTLTPYLIVKDAPRAIEFYKKAFGATELFRMPCPEGSVMHAELKIGDSIFMLTEENKAMGCVSPTTLKGAPSFLYVYVPDVDAVWNKAVKAGAKIKRPLEDQFYGDRNGQLTDPFGHEWSLATHKEDLSSDQISERAKERFGALAKA